MPEGRHVARTRARPSHTARAGLAGLAAAASVLFAGLTVAAAGVAWAPPTHAPAALAAGVERLSASAPPPSSGSEDAAPSGLQDPRPFAADVPAAGVVPVRLTIPDIGVDTSLVDLSIGDGGVLLPPPDLATAGWYPGSAVPGAVGPAVLAGHVDDTEHAGVFARLGELRPGAAITVTLSDGRDRGFVVDRAVDVAKTEFPTVEVYGSTPTAQLRLITCNGPYDFDAMHYRNNLVVFASARS